MRSNAIAALAAALAIAACGAALADTSDPAASPAAPADAGAGGTARAPSQNAMKDYPTSALADYVLGCMKSNGETREALERCSCSIDVIATLLPYARYEEAGTYLSLGQVAGERGVIFRTSELARDAVGDLRRAQIEAELRCF